MQQVNAVCVGCTAWVVLLMAVVTLALVLVQTLELQALTNAASGAFQNVGSRLSSKQVDQAIANALGSISNVHGATHHAANAGARIDTGVATVVEAVNASAVLLTQLNTLAAGLVASPKITLALGGKGA